MGKIVDIFAGLVVVAGITTVVSNAASADIIRAVGQAFSSSMLAAQGKAS